MFAALIRHSATRRMKPRPRSRIVRFVMAVTMVVNLANFAQRMVAVGLNHQTHEISRMSHKLLGLPQKFGGNPKLL
jgi:hypothetical protein